jgi:GntR family transcriptional regulator, transcriptional repressor for pyruvate dehydrogenase complex
MARQPSRSRDIPETSTSSREIAEKLTRRIFRQEYQKGAKLPSERELCDEYGVARNVVREAVKRLEALGMVRSWRGSGVYVQDIEFMRGIDMFDTLITQEDGTINIQFLREVVEYTANFVRFVVRLAAIHRTAEDIEALKQGLADWVASREDAQRQTELSNELHRRFVEATHNRVCMGLFSTLERISARLFSFIEMFVLDFEQKQKTLIRLIEAVEEHDPVLAESVVFRYIGALDERLGTDSSAQSLIAGLVYS